MQSLLFGQESDFAAESDTTNSIYSYAVQYYLVSGVFFAFKFNNNHPNIWRIKFDFSGSIIDETYNHKWYDNDELTGELDEESDSRRFYFSLSTEYNYFFNIHKRFEPFIGIGPIFSYSTNKNILNTTDTSPNNSSNTHEGVQTNYGLGLIGVFGVESTIYDFVRFFIEYNITYTYNWLDDDYKSYYLPGDSLHKSEGSGNSWNLNMSSAKIGILLYF